MWVELTSKLASGEKAPLYPVDRFLVGIELGHHLAEEQQQEGEQNRLENEIQYVAVEMKNI